MTTYETQARARKATILIDWCRRNRITADMAAVATENLRQDIAAMAGQNPPSDATWAIVVHVLGQEIDAPADPFAGL